MSKCENEFTVFELVEGNLKDEERSEVEQHLSTCYHCKTIYDEFYYMKQTAGKFYSEINIATQLNENKTISLLPVRDKYSVFRYAALIAVFTAALIFSLVNINNYGTKNLSNKETEHVQGESFVPDESKWNLQVKMIEQEILFIKEQLPEKL